MRSDLKKILEQLTDPENDDPIELENDRGEVARFSQMALIPITTPSEEFEEEMIDHHFALLQPIGEDGEDSGDQVIFDFLQDENGEVNISLVDDPYVLRDLMVMYRERGKFAELEEKEQELPECESIFGGTIVGEAEGRTETDSFDQQEERSLEKELASDIAPPKTKEKKSFFGKLFGKK